MTEADQSLELFFGLRNEDGTSTELIHALSAAAKKTVTKAATGAAALRTIVERGISDPDWATAGTELVGQLRSVLLHLSLSELLARGWATYEPLREYCNPDKHPPNERSIVSLNKHSVTSSHHPFIELRVDGMAAGKIDFDVELTATFEMVNLVIQTGKVMAAQPGSVSGSGTIKCGDAKLLERPLGKIELPGRIGFGDGIPINPLSRRPPQSDSDDRHNRDARP